MTQLQKVKATLGFFLVITCHIGETRELTKIVSAGGAVTEIVFELGGGHLITGTDISSLWPHEVEQLPRIGYLRTLNAEGVLSLRPELLLTTPEAGPPAVLEQIKSSHVRVEIIPSGFTPEAVETKIKKISEAIGFLEQGKEKLAKFQLEWQQTMASVSRHGDQPRVLFILAHAGGSPMIAGRNTAADAMIQLAYGVNAGGGVEGYKPLTAEAVGLSNPDVILITDEGLRQIGGLKSLWSNTALSLTSAGRQKRVVSMDSLYLLGFGPRLPQAVKELSNRLRGSHP